MFEVIVCSESQPFHDFEYGAPRVGHVSVFLYRLGGSVSNQNMYTIAGTGCLNGILVNPSSVGVIRHQIGHRMEREARNVVSVPYTGSRIFGVV